MLLGVTKGSGRMPGALMMRFGLPPDPPDVEDPWMRSAAVTFTVPV